MSGTADKQGIMPRSINQIFEIAKNESNKSKFSIKCYMLEIYNDRLVDLLGDDLVEDSAKLQIKKSTKGMMYVHNVHTVKVSTPSETQQWIQKGLKNRHV